MEPATDPVSESAESNAEKDHRNNPFIIRSDTLKKQKDIYGWSLWDERVFIEKLYNQRFNYLLVVYGLLLNILYQVNGMLTTILLGLFGTVLLFVLWVMMNRVYCKLDICLKYLHNIKPDEDQADVLSPLEMSDTDEKQNSGNETFHAYRTPCGGCYDGNTCRNASARTFGGKGQGNFSILHVAAETDRNCGFHVSGGFRILLSHQ